MPRVIIERELVDSFSRGELTRHEIAERLGREVSFGELLAGLHEHGMRLPRVPCDRRSAGVQLVKHLAERTLARAG